MQAQAVGRDLPVLDIEQGGIVRMEILQQSGRFPPFLPANTGQLCG